MTVRGVSKRDVIISMQDEVVSIDGLFELKYFVSFYFQVRWMMYWIVFALFITVELFADLLLAFW